MLRLKMSLCLAKIGAAPLQARLQRCVSWTSMHRIEEDAVHSDCVRCSCRVGDDLGDLDLHVAGQVPDEILTVRIVRDGLRIQYSLSGRVQNLNLYIARGGLPIQEVERNLMRLGVSRVHVDRDDPVVIYPAG